MQISYKCNKIHFNIFICHVTKTPVLILLLQIGFARNATCTRYVIIIIIKEPFTTKTIVVIIISIMAVWPFDTGAGHILDIGINDESPPPQPVP